MQTVNRTTTGVLSPKSLLPGGSASPRNDAAAGGGMWDARIQDIGCVMQVAGCRIWVWDAGGGVWDGGGGI